MFTFVPLAYLASHPFLAYGIIFASFCSISGALCVIGSGAVALACHLDLQIVLAVSLLGDCVNDSQWYWLGRLPSTKLVPFLPIRTATYTAALERTQQGLTKGQYLFIPLAKCMPAGFVGLIAIGALRFPYRKYVLICAPMSLVLIPLYYAPLFLLHSHGFFTNSFLRYPLVILLAFTAASAPRLYWKMHCTLRSRWSY